MKANTFVHYDAGLTADITAGAVHADPAHPQIKFQLPDFQVKMLVQEGPFPSIPSQVSGSSATVAYPTNFGMIALDH